MKIDAHGLECHVAKGDHRSRLIQQTVQKFGCIDILVSNAAVNPAYCELTEVIVKCVRRIAGRKGREVTVTMIYRMKHGR